MPVLCLEPLQATYISNVCADENFSNVNCLYVSNNACNALCNTLLQFDVSVFNIQNTVVSEAKLVLPVSSITSDTRCNKTISLSKIQEEFNEETVTWCTMPASLFSGTAKIPTQVSEDCCISLDITTTLMEWIEQPERNFGIMLGATKGNVCIQIPNGIHCKCGPYILVRYQIIEDLGVGIHLQLTNQSGETLADEAAVIFNKIIEKTPTGIEYNPITGEVTITERGYYIFQWDLNFVGSDNMDYVNVGILDESNGSTIVFNGPMVHQGQMSGTCLKHVGVVPHSFKLVNESAGILVWENIPIQASWLIHKI